MRFPACSFPTCFTSKSSTNRVNFMGLNLGVHGPGTILFWVYSCFTSRFLSILFAISPDWGSSYTTFLISRFYSSFYCFLLV